MNKNSEEALLRAGWEVECESPFEVRNGESFATNLAAKYVAAGVLNDELLDESRLDLVETEPPQSRRVNVMRGPLKIGWINKVDDGSVNGSWVFNCTGDMLSTADVLLIGETLKRLKYLTNDDF